MVSNFANSLRVTAKTPSVCKSKRRLKKEPQPACPLDYDPNLQFAWVLQPPTVTLIDPFSGGGIATEVAPLIWTGLITQNYVQNGTTKAGTLNIFMAYIQSSCQIVIDLTLDAAGGSRQAEWVAVCDAPPVNPFFLPSTSLVSLGLDGGGSVTGNA